jgi:hypothetical protein
VVTNGLFGSMGCFAATISVLKRQGQAAGLVPRHARAARMGCSPPM